MEQFSRECLESNNEVYTHGRQDLTLGSSMEKVYDRAAKLVQSTLDVEGVIVMDVSHCNVLENMSAEGTVSVILHHGDVEMEMEKRQITTEEYHNFNHFFQKYPDGKILEGILPHLFRPYMPTHIRYALSRWFHGV
jgi:putative heme iron utilization protein